MPPAGRLGDYAHAPVDAHGCPACPHSPMGPAVAGSPDVLINGLPALRVGDPGMHFACCGSNLWSAQTGSSTVFFNDLPVHRQDDLTTHCGGPGRLVMGSGDVIVGDRVVVSQPYVAPPPNGWIAVRLISEWGQPMPGERFVLISESGREIQGRLDAAGEARVEGIPEGMYTLQFPDLRDDAWNIV